MSGKFSTARFSWHDRVLCSANLTATAKNLGCFLITRFANRETGRCNPAVSTLAEEMHLAERTVQRAIKELEQAGLIAVVRGTGRGRTSFYRFFLDGVDLTKSGGGVVPFRAAKGDKRVSHSPQERVTNPARKGDTNVTPLKRTMKEPKRSDCGQVENSMLNGGKMHGPVLFVESSSLASVQEWDDWLTARGFPKLDALGCLRNCHEKEGWYLPSRFPPQDYSGENWAKYYIGGVIEGRGRVFG